MRRLRLIENCQRILSSPGLKDLSRLCVSVYKGNGSSAAEEHRVIEVEPNAEPVNSPFPRNRITSTKYTLWTFVPKNLFEQFQRIGNLYFFLTAVVALSIKSPISPLTSSLPLVFVIFVTACKQGYEDFLRYRSDRREIRCEQIVVGDFVRVNRDDDIPCDLLMLYSSEPSGKCFVTTSNLDGETNLKSLQVPKIFENMELSEIVSMRATITCQPPMAGLYTFEGRIHVEVPREDATAVNQTGPLGIDNLVLRGARLKDTDYIVGCAIYTGLDSKLSLNSKMSVNKFSTVEKSINKYILVFMLFLFAEVSFCTVMQVMVEDASSWSFYLGDFQETASFKNLLNDLLSFTILFNYVVPISLYVTLEMQTFLGSLFFGWDLNMYDELTDQPAVVNTSDINEDLGQVEYLFSDKTGTLTENLMIFRRCSIAGVAYMEKDCDGKLYTLPSNGVDKDAQKLTNWNPDIWHFFLSISLCHAVHIAPLAQKAEALLKRVEFRESFRLKRYSRPNSSLLMDPSLPEYQAASADEKALVEAAARCGVVYQGDRSTGEMEVNAKGTILKYERLDTLEFTSDRKRMSVILKDRVGDIWLYCKGADSSVFPLVNSGNVEAAKSHVSDFSSRGFRTLVVGFRKFTEAQFEHYANDVSKARQAMGSDRTKRIERAYDRLENGLTLLGVSAVEDRLQEGVPETMEKLRAAGIKIWVLTGDKAETAENIAFFCGHFKKGTKVLRLMNLGSPQLCFITLTSFERKMKIEPYDQYGLLLDGVSMASALKNSPRLLRNVAMACEAVVCCRMSPLQKSQMVQLVKRAKDRPLTAAIGDGGNDVSMIKEAHVGLGITGKEGRQAAMSADFAFAKFMHLERALLVHGHWYYLRVAILTQYFFYKNLVFITPQFFYSIYNGFSGQALYDSIFLMCFNIFFSSVPILIYGIGEQDYSDKKLLRYPQLYQLHRKNHLLTWKQFLLWMFVAFWQIVAIYYIPYYCWKRNSALLSDSTDAGHWCFSTYIFQVVTLVINIQILLVSSFWTVPFVLSIILTEVFFFAFTFVYSYWYIQYDGDMLYVFPKLLGSVSFWALTLLTVAVCIIPVLIIGIYKSGRPSRLRGKLESREENISDIMATPIESVSPTLPNRKSSSVLPWRGNMTFYDNEAY